MLSERHGFEKLVELKFLSRFNIMKGCLQVAAN